MLPLLSIPVFKSYNQLYEVLSESYGIIIPHICSGLTEFKYRHFSKAMFHLAGVLWFQRI